MKRPWVTLRFRTVSHDGVVPFTVEVQLLGPGGERLRRRDDRGHGIDVRGHRLGREGRGVGLGEGGRRAEAPSDAAGRRGAPRGDGEEVGAQGVDLRADLVLGALAQPDGQDHRGDADHDAEHGQPRAEPVGPDGVEPGAEGVEPAHRSQLRSARGRPGRRGGGSMRWASAATSASWVMSTSVRPAACSSSSRAMTSAADVGVQGPGRLVGQDEGGVADQGPGDGHPLLLATGQLPGPVLHPVAQAHPLQGADGPLPPFGPGDAGVGQRQLDVAPGGQARPAG